VISNVVSLGPSSDRPQFRNSTAANEPIRHQRLRGMGVSSRKMRVNCAASSVKKPSGCSCSSETRWSAQVPWTLAWMAAWYSSCVMVSNGLSCSTSG
jgi:hypothetical protein